MECGRDDPDGEKDQRKKIECGEQDSIGPECGGPDFMKGVDSLEGHKRDGQQKADPRPQPANSPAAYGFSLQRDGEGGGQKKKRKLPVGSPLGDLGDETVPASDVLDNLEYEPEEKKSPQAVAADRDDEQREKDVEVLLNGQRPEVPNKVGSGEKRKSFPDEVLVKEHGAQPEMPLIVQDPKCYEHTNHCKVDPGGGLNAEEAPNVEAFEVKASAEPLLFENASRNQKAADREEQIDAKAADILPGGLHDAPIDPRGVMSQQNAQNGNGPPAIKRW